MRRSGWILIGLVTFLSGCVALGMNHYDDLFGPQQVQQRIQPQSEPQGAAYLSDIKPILDTRCVVCHGCYDAPCQLKLSSPEGIDRGVSKTRVYDGTRLLAESPTRLLFDAQSTSQWREKGFTPILNERVQTEYANLNGSVLYNSLLLKHTQPFAQQGLLPQHYDFSLDRAQTCPTMDEYPDYAKEQPHAGMPYGLPALTNSEFTQLTEWIKQGSPMSQIAPPNANEQLAAAKWESFLNQDDNKSRLAARYIYEHWYLANAYFDRLGGEAFFKLVRSKTPPGEPIELIATVRPFDDPKITRVYYRFMQVRSTILSKTHMPLALNDDKLARLQAQFIHSDYQVPQLPGYAPKLAANPFKVFAAIPVKSRYQFMLDEAELIVKGFIKGPVCRGQIALNVINDHFWVAFVDPEKNASPAVAQLLTRHDDDLLLPAAEQSNVLPLSSWAKYAKRQHDYLEAKTALSNQVFADGKQLNLDLIWQGEGHNQNAALTIFRHFDSATVVKGFIGQAPKTTWVLDYALFERIHYLLVAGFDVYGNIGHQLVTRLYMDFLRLEGEQNFLNLLPLSQRQAIKQHWYRKSHLSLSEFINRKSLLGAPSGIHYHSDDPQAELYDMLKAHLKPVLNEAYDYTAVPAALQPLNTLPVRAINQLPQVSFILAVDGKGEHQPYTLIHHNAHFNISSLLNEEGQRAYEEDTATVVPGFIGDYPEAIWHLPNQAHIDAFVQQLGEVRSESDYRMLKATFGIRRTHPQFWQYSDLLHRVARDVRGVEYGLFDYNRLENR
ncbi:fatty acid cis/trans isomerase [Pseudoalteromonas sp. McH1-42]|uniref:fatty acid cis/trans isomerase n=1 Tax=Pseudoalteromonas sp. McH1-42 TaxID=2917752 RepID=UPI001EF4C821|nr:fatty acid cis/trans isomerase [Pseudoalteromonas sp. McH1-42]MCG7563905.1 fatty acid cis/trans isomerase [Pseudoalteromonas sp. McH1-42]